MIIVKVGTESFDLVKDRKTGIWKIRDQVLDEMSIKELKRLMDIAWSLPFSRDGKIDVVLIGYRRNTTIKMSPYEIMTFFVGVDVDLNVQETIERFHQWEKIP